jgi:hypothetical protein
VNAQLLRESDFNEKMRKTKCSKAVTVQRVCRIAQNEKEVREVLEKYGGVRKRVNRSWPKSLRKIEKFMNLRKCSKVTKKERRLSNEPNLFTGFFSMTFILSFFHLRFYRLVGSKRNGIVHRLFAFPNSGSAQGFSTIMV